jgi:integrase
VTQVRVKGFQIFSDRHGCPRCYHRRTGRAVDLEKAPLGSAEFFAECARIADLAQLAGSPRPGTLGGLIAEYKASRAFLDLRPRTQKDYERICELLRPIGDLPLIEITRPRVVQIRDHIDGKRGRRWANYTKTFLSLLFGWAVDRGHMRENTAFRMKALRRPRDLPRANRPWTDGERLAVEPSLPSHMRVPIALMMYCGLDPQDALRLPKSAVVEGRLDTSRGKTGVPVWMPLPGRLAKIIAEAPVHSANTLCATSRGKPWTNAGFRASWQKVKVRLEREGKVQPGLTLKGLRHTAATILAESGVDEAGIAAYLGQKSTRMARHYSRDADRSRKIAETVLHMQAELDARDAKVVKPSAEVSNPEDQAA